MTIAHDRLSKELCNKTDEFINILISEGWDLERIKENVVYVLNEKLKEYNLPEVQQ